MSDTCIQPLNIARTQLSVEQVNDLLEWQEAVLQGMAEGEAPQVLLDRLCQAAEALVPNALASIMLVNRDDGCLYVCAAPSAPEDAVEALSGLKPGPGGGSCGNVIWSGQHQIVTSTLEDPRWADLRDMAVRFNLGACWSFPVKNREGKVIGTFALTSFEKREPDDFQTNVLQVGAYLASVILALEAQHKQLQELVERHPITGLRNRQRMERDAAELFASEAQFACLYIDLDHFKEVNDAFGHVVGDAVLKQVAARFKQLTGVQEDNLYHFGGDTFIHLSQICSTADDSMGAIKGLATDFIQVLKTPFTVEGAEFNLSASVGISCSSEAQGSVIDLIRMADTALAKAKEKGRGLVQFYESHWQQEKEEKLRLDAKLRQALAGHRLDVHYQPIVDSSNGLPVAFEALVRWNDSEEGMIPPFKFIPVAESSGLIREVDLEVLRMVVEDIRQWQQAFGGDLPFTVAINLSAIELSADHVDRLTEVIRSSGVAHRLELEITESLMMQDTEESVKLIRQIKAAGIAKLAIDDFGTGYSSMGYLKRFKVDKLKIDQSLVRDIDHDPSDRAIARAIVALGKALDLTVVAEGVETETHQGLLCKEGVPLLQGYLFARPMPGEDVVGWVKERRRNGPMHVCPI
ncbi:diguanylate cyclase (GGDEF) domain-containing protein [Sulfurivirga caldicuralii]|uniref:Diguanylate cyclase (GGDEF) domain-containing protein n=1 Tax=Sulfurivirga caldicuralii TaxID=364032 RepID=A0A1N6DSV2_9GAMM|nr:GGDEF domain-containing protein [Sulfurivirga caldicuralii]SIN73820.1 diguanylate cyclase (GGDEF) domain-containing protein [Sulfurivirga caldicuralii]